VYSDRRQRLNLTNYKICNLTCRQLKITTTEVFAIVESGMRAHCDTVVASE